MDFLTVSSRVLTNAPVRSRANRTRRTCCETTMFAAASSFFARSNISQNYNVGAPSSIIGSRSSTPAPGPSNPGALPAPSNTPTFFVGPWKVQSGSHKTTNKCVSVWTFDKKSSELEKMGPTAKDRTLEVLKSEVRTTSLYRFSGFCTHARSV